MNELLQKIVAGSHEQEPIGATILVGSAQTYPLPPKQFVLVTREPGQTEQSRLRHLLPDPVPPARTVSERRGLRLPRRARRLLFPWDQTGAGRSREPSAPWWHLLPTGSQ